MSGKLGRSSLTLLAPTLFGLALIGAVSRLLHKGSGRAESAKPTAGPIAPVLLRYCSNRLRCRTPTAPIAPEIDRIRRRNTALGSPKKRAKGEEIVARVLKKYILKAVDEAPLKMMLKRPVNLDYPAGKAVLFEFVSMKQDLPRGLLKQ